MALNQLGLGLLFTAKDAATGVMHNVRNGFAQTRDEFGKFGNRSKETFKQFGVGIATMGVGLAGLAILGSTITDAQEFGKAIDLVRTEVDEAAFSQESMKDITIDLGKQFGKLPADEAKALYKAVALGANTAEKATSLMTAANQLAVAGNSELTVTMDALGGSLNAYHLQADDAGMVSDAFFTAMKGGNTTVQDLAASVGRVSAGANAMGISVQEVLGAVGVMTNKGIQASEAVSYLHGALANISHPSHDAMVEAKRLGIAFNDLAVKKAGGLVPFLHSITDNAKLNASSLNKLFTSVEGSSAMSMLAGDMGSVDAMMKEMNGNTGATKKGFDIMAQGMSFQTDKLKANFSALKIRIGEFLEPIAARGLGYLNRLLGWFTNLPGPVQGAIVGILSAAAGLVTLVGAVAAGIAAFKILSAGLMTFGGGALGTVVAALGPAIALIGLFYGAFKLLQKAYDEDIGGVGQWFDRLYSQVSLAFEAITQLFTDGGFSGAVREQFLSGSNSAIDFAIQIWLAVNRVKNFLSNLVDGFMSFANQMGPTFKGLTGAVDKLMDSFGILSKTTEEAGTAFDDAGVAGQRTGVFLAKVVEVAIRFATAVINLSANIVPFLAGVASLVDKLGGLESIFWLVKTAAEAFGVYMLLTLSASIVDFGASLGPLGVKLVTLASGLNIGAVASAFSAAMRGMLASTAAAMGPIAALTAAVMALYLAYTQWQALSKSIEGTKDQSGKSHFWSDIRTKMRSDLGIDSEEETFRRMGGHVDTASERSLKAREAQLAAAGGPTSTIPNTTPSDMSSMPALASLGPSQSMDPQAFASAAGAAAAAAASNRPSPTYVFKGEVDGQTLISFVKKASDADKSNGYEPNSSQE